MSRKQIKISVDPDIYEILEKRAEQENLPVATYTRQILSDIVLSASDNQVSKDDELVFLSDVLAGKSEELSDADQGSGKKNITAKKDGKVINININL